MPTWAATLLVGTFTVITNALVVAYYAGRMTTRVENLEAFAKNADESEKDQWSKINRLREDVGKLKGKVGLNGT
jgi:hypothetical protein